MGKILNKVSIVFTILLICVGCAKLDTTHTIEVKPMHITIDVNLKVDKELDNFFDDIDKQDASMDKK